MRLLASSLTPSWNFVYFSLAVLLLAWLCRDYPSWRRERLEQSKTTSAENTTTLKHSHSEPVQQTATGAPGRNDLSILHYILAMPAASVYIVARAMFDASRSIIFWTLWGLEKSAPYVDDWLFDTLTVWLPNKFSQLDQWWAERGRLLWQNTQDYTTHHMIPTVIHAVEQLFSTLARLGGALHKIWIDLTSVWQTFIDMGEWRKAAIDLIESRIVPGAARLWRLGIILYKGWIHIGRSVWQDILWTGQVVLPAALDAIAATHLYLLFRSGAFVGIDIVHWVAHKVITPLFRILQPAVLRVMDAVILILQSRLFQRRCNQVRNAFSVRMVWFVLEVFEHVESFVQLMGLVFSHVLLPVATWYMREIHPGLSRAYRRWVAALVYRVFVPTWNMIQPYLYALYGILFNLLSVPLEALWSLVQTMAWRAWDLGQEIGVYLGSAVQGALRSVWPVIQIISSHTAVWLENQIPSIMQACQLAWDLVGSYDWLNFWTEITQWSTVQGEALFLSLERILTNWIKAQAPEVEDPVLKKTN